MNYAYVTLATTSRYLKFVQYLQISLKRVKAKFPLIVMITSNLIDEEILNEFDQYIVIPYEKFFNTDKHCQRYNDTLCKFFAFTLTDFNKICFLDADMFLLENIDDLFNQIQEISFVTSMYKANYCNKEIVPRGGLMFLTPEEGKYEHILAMIEKNPLKNIPMTDETVLKYYLFPQMISFQWDNQCSTFEELNLNLNKLIFIHGKWHSKLKINPSYLLSLNNEEIFNLVLLYHDIKTEKKRKKEKEIKIIDRSILIAKGSLNNLL